MPASVDGFAENWVFAWSNPTFQSFVSVLSPPPDVAAVVANAKAIVSVDIQDINKNYGLHFSRFLIFREKRKIIRKGVEL